MNARIPVERMLTELDFSRLGKLLDAHRRPQLEALLDEAEVLRSSEVPQDVVTMNSQVELRDLRTGQRQTLTLCYPGDAEARTGMISVLSPVGGSVLGLRVGSVARWQPPSGEEGAAEVTALLFQPEANGLLAM